MKPRVLPTVISAIMAGGMNAAAAEVTLFGHIDTSIDATDQDGGSDDINMNCTTCSIGFKGSEDLGNGLKAIFMLDFQYDTTERNNGIRGSVSTGSDNFVTSVTTTKTKGGNVTNVGTNNASAVTKVNHSNSGKDALFDRDQWLGLAGNFGKVRIGTISTPYKSHGAMIDPLYRTALQGRDHGLQSSFHSGAGENLQGRATNTLRYDSPSWNGLQVAAFYTLDSDEGDGEDNDPYGLGVSYENGNILAFADYQDNNGSSSDPGGELTAWKVGGKYSSNMFGVMGQYEDSEADDGTSTDMTVWHVGAHGTLFGITGYLGYGKGEADVSGGSTEDYTAWTLALMYDMSKRTKVYMGHTQADCDDGAGEYFSACQIDRNTNADGEVDQFSVGMKHKF